MDLNNLRTSGLIGLSPTNAAGYSDLFIEKMKKDGLINKAMFSMSVAHDDL